MNHASKSHDAIELLIQHRERINALLLEEDARSEKLKALVEDGELALLFADMLSVLRDVPQRNLSESQRNRILGVKQRVQQAIRRAA
jgi:hypothetical protein